MADQSTDADALFDAQIKRELQMSDMGVRDFRKSNRSSEERRYASHTIYGSWARKQYTLPG